MKEATVTAADGRTGPRPSLAEGVSASPDLVLRRLDRALESELRSLRAGVDPLLAEVRRSVAALYPGADTAPLMPKPRQEECARLGQMLDTLEDVLEALQVAAHHHGEG